MHGLTTVWLYQLLSSQPLYQPQNGNLQLWRCTGCLHFPWYSAFLLPSEFCSRIELGRIGEGNSCSLRQEPQGSSWIGATILVWCRGLLSCFSMKRESDLDVAVTKKLLILAHQPDKDVFTGQCTINYITKMLMYGFSPPWDCLEKKIAFLSIHILWVQQHTPMIRQSS